MTSKTPTLDFKPLFAPEDRKKDLSSHRYRLLIGVLGFMLPILLLVIAWLRPTKGIERLDLLSSVSAYYYTEAVVAFVGVLVALGIFLVTYSGYDNKYNRLDRCAAIIAGLAAIGVALFPTKAPPGITNIWWTPIVGKIHYFCALVLFGAFIFFSLYLFPKSNVKKGEPLPSGKRMRNIFYRFSGWAMAFCMVWIFINLKFTNKKIFLPEAIALEFFAVSWLLKGRADWTVSSLGMRTLHFLRLR